MLLYSLLYLMTLEDLKQFRQVGSKSAGHPEYGPRQASKGPPACQAAPLLKAGPAGDNA
jgi:hypothetical protein